MTIPPESESTLQRVFQDLATRGEASVRDLARTCGLKPSTLEEKVRRLKQKGLVIADGEETSVTGKVSKSARGMLRPLRINPGFGYLVGIDMGASHVHFALTDFCGEILSDSNIKIRPEDGPRKMIAQIKENVGKIVAAWGSPSGSRRTQAHRPKLEGLGIGVPSPVDPRTGLVSFANNLPGWTNIDLRGALQEAFDVPVALENDANMAAVGEHWRGAAHNADNFVFIALGTGIGSGIFADGRLIRGRTGAAGELYLFNVEWQRWNEDFGDTGYFESQVSGLGIAREGRKQLDGSSAGRAGPERAAEGLAKERDAHFVFDAFRLGDSKARAVLEKVFTMLGVAIADLVAVLDPDLIVLGGGITRGAPEFLLSTVTKVAKRIQPGAPPITLSTLEENAQTYGAIFSALTVAREKIRGKL
jgi:predicted NBD/HSP70 family sugar kinase